MVGGTGSVITRNPCAPEAQAFPHGTRKVSKNSGGIRLRGQALSVTVQPMPIKNPYSAVLARSRLALLQGRRGPRDHQDLPDRD